MTPAVGSGPKVASSSLAPGGSALVEPAGHRHPRPHSTERSDEPSSNLPGTGTTDTDATLPAGYAPLQAALCERRVVQVYYHDRCRMICPHALGWKNHRAMVLGYQVGGQTSTGALDPDPRKRWRCLFVDEIGLVTAEDTASWQTADNYNPTRPFNAVVEVAVAIGNDPTIPMSASA
jgi:hypothetical protein